METLLKEINELLKAKNTTIGLLQWEVETLKKENENLKTDIEKCKENEVNKA